MADTSTTHIGLVKQDPNALPDYRKDHLNLDTLDTEIWSRAKTFNGEPVGNDGGFHVDSVPNADNLNSSMGQNDTGTYIIRTSGGEASIEDEGSSWLMSIKGNYVKTGHVDRIINMTVSPVGEDGHITATIDEDTYESQMTQDGTTVFTYSTGWNLDPATYGITVDGEPVAGDVIQVVYAKEIPGTITQSYPVKFVSTGWNLYDHANRRAMLIKYSDQYNFKISGAYTSLEFVDSATGTTTVISPVSGAFALPAGSEGGVLNVNGGDATTTAIWMTWSDWVSGYRWKNGAQGAFQAYTESVIDMTAYMAQKFSNGLLSVGTVQDEINFNIGLAFSRVERMENDASGVNKAAAKASGRQYDYDANWVYLERATPIEYDLTYTVTNDELELDGTYTSDDHGLEMFTNTTVEVTANALYGQNLKNKLERNVLTISNQDLDASQKSQVMVNLGLGAAATYGVKNNLTTSSDGYLLDAKQGKVLKDAHDAFAYTTIETSTNLNNLKTPGFYSSNSTATTSTLSGKPSTLTSAFTMIVMKKSSSTTQVVFTGGTMYCRTSTSGGWGTWYSYAGTAVT